MSTHIESPDERQQRYADAIWEDGLSDQAWFFAEQWRIVDAVIAVADAEQATLRAEVERIRDLAERGVAAEARAVHDLEAEVERLQAIVSAAALETYTPDGSERFVAQFWEVLRRAKAAEAKVVRVKRLMENREAERPFKTVAAAGVPFPTLVTVDEIRAALSGPDASDA